MFLGEISEIHANTRKTLFHESNAHTTVTILVHGEREHIGMSGPAFILPSSGSHTHILFHRWLLNP